MRKVSYGAMKGVMRRERAEIVRFLREAEELAEEARRTRDEIHAYLKAEGHPTKEGRALLRDATKLVRETEDRLTYMRGALAGASAMESVVLKYMILQNLGLIGR